MYRTTGPLYQTGSRFSLQGWSAEEWATFFAAAGPAATQIYSTVTGRPAAPAPVPVQVTPIGAVPTWAIVSVAALAGFALLGLGGRRRRG